MAEILSRWRPGRRAASRVPMDSVELGKRVAGLELATRMATGRVPAAAVAGANEVLAVAAARRELAGDHTVVALAGATGAGKSSIFNALVGAPVARVSALRPTTGEPMAAVWNPGSGVTSLLEWLGVPHWHVVGPDDGQDDKPAGMPAAGDRTDAAELAGLVLVDLPDHDSTESAHRLHVDRLVARADVMVWVMDPQKYADALVHDQYLARFARHGEVTIVALNQVDTLAPADVGACTEHLRGLLAADGLPGVRVLPTSTRTGAGLAELRDMLAAAVAARTTAMVRIAADMAAAADALAGASGDTGATLPVMSRGADDQLAATLAHAAGVDVVAAAVAESVRRAGQVQTGWPGLRWLPARRVDPLSDLRLSRPGVAPELIGTSMPSGDPVALAAASAAIRQYADTASRGAPPGWVRSARARAAGTVSDLVPELDRAVAGARVGPPRAPRWWRLVGALQWVFLVIGCVGALWLLGLLGLSVLAIPRPEPPTVGALPAPTIMLVSGLLIGFVVAGLSALANRRTSARAAAAARAAVTEQVAELVRTRVTGPIGAELATLEDFRVGLLAARGEG